MRNKVAIIMIILGICLLLTPAGMYIEGIYNQRQLEHKWQESVSNSKPDIQAPERNTPIVQIKQPVKNQIKSKKQIKSVRRNTSASIKLIIPKIGLNAVVVEGTSSSALRRGPGHFPGTALPGEQGNCCIAGHRNMYGSWFRKLNKLYYGDTVMIKISGKQYIYKVVKVFTVRPNDLSVLKDTSKRTLTLITCTPVPRPTHRLIVIAEMTDSIT
ncbi:MAG: sortase [Armatimonadota bacterium]